MRECNYFYNNEYKEPTLIKFDTPLTIKLCELDEYLEEHYKPFASSEVWAFERFEYGDYDNWIDAIIESRTISPRFCQVYREAMGIYNAGESRFEVRDAFWSYRENYPFWRKRPSVGYNSSYKGYKYIDEVEVTIDGVFIISYSDMESIEKKYDDEQRKQIKESPF